MATAMVLAADGRRKDGRWRRGSVAISESGNSESQWSQRLAEAGIVLDYAPDLAEQVVAGTLTLHAAYTQADANRRSTEADQIAEREQARRDREEATETAEPV
ncbi:MAG: hypothetical protein ACR2KL_10950 [Nocardioidaceae bacterium]